MDLPDQRAFCVLLYYLGFWEGAQVLPQKARKVEATIAQPPFFLSQSWSQLLALGGTSLFIPKGPYSTFFFPKSFSRAGDWSASLWDEVELWTFFFLRQLAVAARR